MAAPRAPQSLTGVGPGYRGRLAPSPTGRLHLGVARTALLAWLDARAAGGVLLHRVEDLDGPRTVAGAAAAIADDLRFLGLDWDEGYDGGTTPGPYHQSQRGDFYERALAELARRGLLFPCSCTRKEVREASSAPHGELGPQYPGTCRLRPQHPERPQSLRFRMPDVPHAFVDGVFGAVDMDVRDDFIVRRADGLYAYQLAVVVDDIAMGVTHVVRGADLLSSTHRQLALYAALDAAPPRFSHVPLWLSPDGRRLAKRDGAVAVADYRAAGVSPHRLLGALAASVGLCPLGAEVTPRELLQRYRAHRLPMRATPLSPRALGLPDMPAV